MKKVEASASALEAVFKRVNEIVAIAQWQRCECEATVAALLGHMTAAVHMGCLMPPSCANWMVDDEPQSCGQDTWLCGVIPKEKGELVNSSSSPKNKAEVETSSMPRNLTDKAISEVQEVPVAQIKANIIKTSHAVDANKKIKTSRTIRKSVEKQKPKVKRIVEDSNNKKDGSKRFSNAPTTAFTRNASKPRGITDHCTKPSGVTNTKQTKRKIQAQGCKEATKIDSETTEPQTSAYLPEVVATDSKSLNCDEAHLETTPAEPPLQESKQPDKLSAVKHYIKRTTTQIPRSFTNKKEQIQRVSIRFATSRKPQMGLSTNQNRNHKSHESTEHNGTRSSEIFNQSGTIRTNGFTIPTDDYTMTTNVSAPKALPKTRRPTSADRRATRNPPISLTERNGVV